MKRWSIVMCIVLLNGFLLPGITDTAKAGNTGLLFYDFGLKTVVESSYQERLPGSDSLDEAFRLMTGIPTRLEYLFIHGANRNENRFTIDGFNQTDCLTGLGYLEISPEIVDSIEIISTAAPAEYDSVMGGIFNAKTRSGTNAWHGRVRINYVNTEWVEEARSAEYSPYYNPVEYDYFHPTLVLDGPIVKDKLWFLASYSFYSYELDYMTIGFYGDDYNSYSQETWKNVDRKTSARNPYLNVLYKPLDDHRIKLSYHSETMFTDNHSGDLWGATPEAFLDWEDALSGWNLDWTWDVKDDLIIHAALGVSSHKIEETPQKQSGDPRDAPFHDSYFDQYYNNGSIWSDDERSLMEINADVTWNADNIMGDHTFKAGLGIETSVWEISNRIPGGASYYIDPYPNGSNEEYFMGTDAERTVLINSGHTETSSNVLDMFVQDEWRLHDAIRLNLGFRYEIVEYETDDGSSDVAAWTWGNFHGDTWLNSDGTPRETAPMRFDDMIAPRFRVDWDVFQNQSWVVHGAYGRYYSRFDHHLPHMFQPFSSDPYAFREQEYVGPQWTDRDKDGVPDENYFFDNDNWETAFEDQPLFPNLIDTDLEAEYTDEVVVGFSHKLSDQVSIGLNYIYRKTNDMIEDVGLFLDDDGNIVWTYRGAVNDTFTGLKPGWDFDPRAPRYGYTADYTQHIYFITNADGNEREYSGVELTVEAKDAHWDARLFYTYSQAEGATTDGNRGYSAIAPFSGLFDSPGTSTNLYGELPWSATHIVRMTGAYWYDLTDWYEMSFGANLTYNSGYHYSSVTKPDYTYNPDGYDDFDDPSTWTGYPVYRSYYWHYRKPRGSFELPDHFNADISWQHRFNLDNYGGFTVIFDVKNLFDEQEIIAVSDTYNPSRPDLSGYPLGWSSPRSYHLSVKYSF